MWHSFIKFELCNFSSNFELGTSARFFRLLDAPESRMAWFRACDAAQGLKMRSVAGLPDFPWHNLPKRGKIYHMTTKFPNGHKIFPIDRKIDQM
jgi:hypothetical protein